MKYKERDELVSSLREFADFIEDKGVELPAFTVDVNLYARTWDRKTFEEIKPTEVKRNTKRLIRALPKPVEKRYSSGTFTARVKFGKSVTFSYNVARKIVCKAVPTGRTIVHAATVIPERVEEEVEWVCTDPLLKETAKAL